MNGLSWLLYAADLSQNLQVVGGFMIFAAAILGFLLPPKGSDMFGEGHHGPFMGFARAPVVALLLVGVCLVAVLPSRNTVMLIAASEIGETVITSDSAKEISGEAGQLASDSLRLLRKYVSEQLDDSTAD